MAAIWRNSGRASAQYILSPEFINHYQPSNITGHCRLKPARQRPLRAFLFSVGNGEFQTMWATAPINRVLAHTL